MKHLIDELEARRDLSDESLAALLTRLTPEDEAYLYARGAAVREREYGNAIYLRGLIRADHSNEERPEAPPEAMQ